MKKITLFITLLTFCFVSAQTTLFEDDFESYTDFAISGVGSWTLTDVDGLPTYGFNGVDFPDSGNPKSFQVFNSTTTVAPLAASATSNWEAYNSTKGMVCFAAVPAGGVSNNDWLISPQITLADGGNSVSFWYKACDQAFSNEMFTVGISTTDTMPASFTTISATPESVPLNDITWRQYTAILPATYDNTPIYIGINCVSNDQFGFMIDDFAVSSTSLSVEEFDASTITTFYNKQLNSLILESSNSAFTAIEVYDILGKRIVSNKLNSNEETINLETLQQGAYITKVSTLNGTKTIKFIKN